MHVEKVTRESPATIEEVTIFKLYAFKSLVGHNRVNFDPNSYNLYCYW
jgi:hypothetical protein